MRRRGEEETRDKPRAARKWVLAVREKVRSLARLPMLYEVIPEAPEIGHDYRHIIYGNYRIIYRIELAQVIVVRIIHAARMLRASMLSES